MAKTILMPSVHDRAPVEPTKQKPGQVPEGRFAVIDKRGNMRGHVGPKATQATCRRFGVEDAEFSGNEWRGK